MEQLGNATHLGTFANQSPEWHNLRRTGIGGSDVGTITRCNPWSSPFALWAKKTGRIEDDAVTSEAAEWGTRLESVVLDKFEESHPELILRRDCGTWANIEKPYLLANPDALYQSQNGTYGIVEVKTSRFEDDWAGDNVPAYYRTQVQHYLHVFGLDHAYVLVLFAGSKYRELEITADKFEQETNLAEIEKFREYLASDTQPDYDGALSTYETIRSFHPDIEDEAVELGDLGVYYELAVAEYDKANDHLNELKSRVLDAMGNAKRGLINDEWRLTRQSRAGGKPFLVKKKG